MSDLHILYSYSLLVLLICSFVPTNGMPVEIHNDMVKVDSTINYEQLAADFLERVISGEAHEDIQHVLADADPVQLFRQLDTDAKKKAFWINIYNAYIIVLLKKNPSLYENKGMFFSTPHFEIAGKTLSFDDIEHGIIRRSRIKISLGYLSKWFPSMYEKAARVKEIDYRIHFALNCGAASCPPVRIFKAESINKQLEENTNSYLSLHATYNQDNEKVTVTPLMSWFRADFGGMSGIRDILQERGIVPDNVSPSIAFEDYDWTIDLDNIYIDEERTAESY